MADCENQSQFTSNNVEETENEEIEDEGTEEEKEFKLIFKTKTLPRECYISNDGNLNLYRQSYVFDIEFEKTKLSCIKTIHTNHLVNDKLKVGILGIIAKRYSSTCEDSICMEVTCKGKNVNQERKVKGNIIYKNKTDISYVLLGHKYSSFHQNDIIFKASEKSKLLERFPDLKPENVDDGVMRIDNGRQTKYLLPVGDNNNNTPKCILTLVYQSKFSSNNKGNKQIEKFGTESGYTVPKQQYEILLRQIQEKLQDSRLIGEEILFEFNIDRCEEKCGASIEIQIFYNLI